MHAPVGRERGHRENRAPVGKGPGQDAGGLAGVAVIADVSRGEDHEDLGCFPGVDQRQIEAETTLFLVGPRVDQHVGSCDA